MSNRVIAWTLGLSLTALGSLGLGYGALQEGREWRAKPYQDTTIERMLTEWHDGKIRVSGTPIKAEQHCTPIIRTMTSCTLEVSITDGYGTPLNFSTTRYSDERQREIVRALVPELGRGVLTVEGEYEIGELHGFHPNDLYLNGQKF